MVKVIYIGMYNNNGIFISENWYEVIDWLNDNCDSLIIYCDIKYKKINKIFDQSCNIEIMKTPDKDINIKAYRFSNFNNEFWNIIKNMDYCIDSGEFVSHLFFMVEENLLCMLEVTDYENYLMIYDIKNKKIDYRSIISNTEHNHYLCNQHVHDINDLADGEEWMPY